MPATSIATVVVVVGLPCGLAGMPAEAGSALEPRQPPVAERTLAGVVLDEAGLPLPGVQWWISGLEAFEDGNWRLVMRTGAARRQVTSADGSFQVRFREPVRYDIQLSKLGYAPVFLFQVAADWAPPRVVMKRGQPLRGVVLRRSDDRTHPVPGTTVTLRLPNSRGLWYSERALTGTDGHFEFRVLPAPEPPPLPPGNQVAEGDAEAQARDAQQHAPVWQLEYAGEVAEIQVIPDQAPAPVTLEVSARWGRSPASMGELQPAGAGAQTRPLDGTRQGKGGQPAKLPADAVRTMDRFRHALGESDYARALALCSGAVREAARQHGGAADYLRAVVPVEELGELTSYPVWHTRTTPERARLFGCYVRLSATRADAPRVSWEWTMEATGDGWVIDFPPIPLQQRIDNEQARLRRERSDHEAMRQELQGRMAGVRTRLSSDGPRYRSGEPILLRLELVNGGEFELSYDDQQAAVNRSLRVTRQDGQPVAWIGGTVQTQGAYRSIGASETVVLFRDLDIARDYDMTAPGRYRIQFSGHGLRIGQATPQTPGMPEASIPGMPSNTIEIEVVR